MGGWMIKSWLFFPFVAEEEEEDAFVVATGGIETTDGDYKIHTFIESGTLTINTAGEIEYLVVAGGGSGGGCDANNSYAGGGGGAGGYCAGTLTLTLGVKTVTIGAGGTGANSSTDDGEDSVFDSITAIKGGGGARGAGTPYPAVNGNDGGSGGASTNGGIAGNGEVGPPRQGYNGGTSGTATGASDGGGGSAQVGQDYSGTTGGAGGAGTSNSISGSPVTYAVGGNGGSYSSHADGTSGTTNRGNGGKGANGGGTGTAKKGGDGGSGIVIIRYKFRSTEGQWMYFDFNPFAVAFNDDEFLITEVFS